MYRVVQWGTGVTGKKTVRGIVHHPELELVGVVTVTPEKDGKDAGQLCGMDQIGVKATLDVDAVLDLEADCMCFMGEGMAATKECLDAVVRFLERGTNVVSPSIYPAIYPARTPAEYSEPILAACKRGGSTFYETGAAPGIMTMQVPILLLSQCDEVRSIRTQELFDLNHYDNFWVLSEVMGFGKPPEYQTLWEQPHSETGIDHFSWFRGELAEIGDLVGVEIEDLEFHFQKYVTDHPVDSVMGTLEAGTVTAWMFSLDGMVNGKPFLRHEHVTRMSDDAGPDWDRPSIPNTHAYTCRIEGSPPWFAEISVDRDDPNRGTAGMHAVNAIPLVCQAAPGHVGWADLGPYSARNVKI